MKITLNLSPAPSLRDRYALVWAIPATLVGLAVLVVLSRSSLREYREYQGNQEQIAKVQRRSEELSRRESDIRRKLEDPVYQKLLYRAHFVNKLIDERQLSLSDLSARLAGLLPEDAHLTGLALTPPKKPGDDYAVRLGITAKGEDAVETFINDLEDSPDFKDVAIINQGFQEDTSQGQQVNLICTARYLPGVDVDAVDKSEKPKDKSQKTADKVQNPGLANPNPADKPMNPSVERKKREKGAKRPSAQEPTSSRKPII